MHSNPPISKQGFERLLAEIQKLKTKDRPRIIKEISSAREHGDLKENAEYHAAKDQQSIIEARILELEAMSSHAQIIDVETLVDDGKVRFGSTVTIIRDDQTKQEITIVGSYEADVSCGKIAFSAPLAKQVIGKAAGDMIEWVTPAGNSESFHIDSITKDISKL